LQENRLRKANEQYAQLKSDPKILQEMADEEAEWDKMLQDGLYDER
jgi:hypothetical protein